MTIRDELQSEVINTLKDNNYEGSIILPTGVGKGKILVDILNILKPKNCWYLCDSARNRDVTFKNELFKWGAVDMIDSIKFMCYQTAYKVKGDEVDLLLADEVDFALTPNYSKVFFNNTFKRKILVTGTVQQDQRRLLNSICPIIFEKTLSDIEGKGVVNTTNYFRVKYNLNEYENKKYLSYNYALSSAIKAKNNGLIEILNIRRNLFLNNLESSASTCKKLLRVLYKDKDNKVLVFCGSASQADKVCRHSYHSKSKTNCLTDFNLGIIRVVSVVGKIDRGENMVGVNNLIFEAPYKSRTKQQQKSGRGRRLDVDKTLNAYFLVPYFKNKYGKLEPTIVNEWVNKSLTENFKIKDYEIL